MRRVLLALVVLFIISDVSATTYYSQVTGTFNTLSNWNSNRGGGGTSPSNFTTSGDRFIVQGTGNGGTSPHTMTVTGAAITFGANVTVEIENGGIMTCVNSVTFNATATFQINAGGTFNWNNTGSYANLLAGVENFAATSNFIINSSATTGPGTPTTGFGNLTFAATASVNSSGALNDAGSNTGKAIQGNLTVSGTSFRLTGNTALTMSIGGNLLIQTGGTFTLGNGTASPVINIGGNFTMSGGTLDVLFGAAATATVNFNKSGTQVFSKTGGTITAATSSSRAISFVVLSGAILDIGTSVLDAANTSTINFTVNSGGALITANTNGITSGNTASGSIQNLACTRSFNTGANYTYNASGAQVTGTGLPATVNKLTIDNGAGVTLTSSVGVSSELILTSGKLTLGANNITLTGATITGASSSNYVVTSSTGKILRSITSSGGSFLFPTGRNSSTYNPITITNSGGSTAVYTVGVAQTTYTPSASGTNAQWSIAAGASTTSTLAFEWLTADAGATLNASPTSGTAFQYNGISWDNRGGSTSGTPNVTTVSGITDLSNLIWTVAKPSATPDVTLNEISTVGAASIAQATTSNIIYNFKLDVATSDATLNQVTIPTTGDYTSSDITNLKLWYKSSNDFSTAVVIKTISTPAGATTETFSGLSQAITSGNTGFFWVTADVAGGATVGRTITVTPALDQTNFTFSAGVNFTTGTINAGGLQTISAGTSGVTLNRISDVGAANIQTGSTSNIIYNFKLDVTSVAATLTQVVINTSGNYTSSDISNLKLLYNNANNFGTASTIKTIAAPAGATSETFAGLSQAIGIGATGYFWITADVAGGATAGRTITVTPALSFTELTFAGAISPTTGTINAGGTQTIVSTPSVALSEISTVGAASIAQATTNNIIYNFKLDVTDASTTVNQVTIATSGDYTSGDLTNMKLWYHTANNFGSASVIKTITPAGASLETFGSLSQAISSGTTGYFWVTADVAGGATVGRTITVTPAIAQSNLTFSAAVNFSTGTINAGGTQTVSAGTPGVTLSEISTIGAANISQGSTSNIIYNFKLAVTSVAATLTQVTIPTTGDYTSLDITNLKLWYKSSNDFSTATNIKTINTPAGATTETFAALSQSIGIGATGFFWVTADVAGAATTGRTITVTPALAFSNLTFSGATSNTTGTINAGGTQTIVAASNATDAFRSKATGNWNDATPGNVWESFTNGGWMDATLAPGTSAASITIQNTHTVTVPNGASISADDVTVDVGGQITIASGGTLTITNGAAAPDITVNGYLKNSGTLTMTGAGTISGSATYEHNLANLTIPTFTWASSSTLRLTGTYTGAGTVLLAAGNYQNITYEGTIASGSDYVSLGDNVVSIAGKLTISGSGLGAVLTSAPGTSPTVAQYEQTSGIVFINRNSGSARSLTVTGNAVISGGTLHIKTLAGAGQGTFTVGGDLTVGASGTINNSGTAGTAALQFSSAIAQQWSNAGTLAGSTNGIAVSVSGTGGVTLNTDLAFPISSATQSSLSLTSGNFTIAAAKTFTLANTQPLSITAGRTLTVNGTFVNSSTASTPSTGTMAVSSTGTYIHNTTASAGNMLSISAGNLDAASTWIYRGSSSLTPAVSISARTFGNLSFESTSGSLSGIPVSGGGALTVNGSLSIGGGGAGTMALTFSGYTGTITVASGVTIVASNSFTLGSSTMNVGGNWANSGTFTAGTSILNFNGTAAQSITKAGGESFSSLTISNTSNTVTAANNLTSGATFTTSAGSILDMGTNILTVSTVSHAGTLKTQNTGATPITSGKTWGGTVQYNSASSQTIVNGNYTDLNGTGGDRTLASSGTIGIAGTFTPGAGTYTITGSTINFNKSSASQTVNAFAYNHLTLSGAATKSFAGNASMQGDFTVSGGAVTAPTTMTFNGGSAQSIAGLAYDNVAFDGAGNKTFNSDGSVATAITFAAGQAATIDFDGAAGDKTFTVKSTATYTARVENKQSYTLSGNIKAERYFPSRRAWRLVAAPVGSTGSIWSQWQNNGNNTAGIGMLITGPGADPVNNGLDASTQNNTTLYTYDQPGNAWTAVSNTKTKNISDHAGYLAFIRGDRDPNNLVVGNSNTTTIHSIGAIKSGDQAYTTNTGTGYTFLGNPYPSPIDFDAAWTDATNGGGVTTSNVLRKFYTYDPTIGDRGGYVTVSYNGATYDVVPSSGTTAQTQHIQSGQAFFVEADGTANTNQFTLKESHKSSANINTVFRAGNQFERLAVNLKRINTDGSIVTMDGILANFHNSFSAGLGNDDASKFANFDETVSFKRNGRLLSIEAMPLADVHDTLFLDIANMKQRGYQFIMEPSGFNAPGLTAYLEDAFLASSTQLSLSAPTLVAFTVTSDAATSAANRFRIVFRSNTPLPVTLISTKAFEVNSGIQVEWTNASESGINRYEVEESADAVNFTKSKTVLPKTNDNAAAGYSWVDNTVSAGANYYRIRCISNAGETKLSAIMKVVIGKGSPGVVIYPNPVKDRRFTLQMNNMERGSYTMNIYNAAGQRLLTHSFMHGGGSGTESLQLGSQFRPGIYRVEVVNGTAGRFVQTIVIND